MRLIFFISAFLLVFLSISTTTTAAASASTAGSSSSSSSSSNYLDEKDALELLLSPSLVVSEQFRLSFLRYAFSTMESLVADYPLLKVTPLRVERILLSSVNAWLSTMGYSSSRAFVTFVASQKLKTEQQSSSVGSTNDVSLASSSSSANSTCISCYTIHNIIMLMCQQNFSSSSPSDQCVSCQWLFDLSTLLCSLQCTPAPPTGSLPPTSPSTVTCIMCNAYASSIMLMCPEPNCSTILGAPSASASLDDHSLEITTNAFKRSTSNTKVLSSLMATSSSPYNNCVPCSKQWLGYQLLCGNLIDYCAIPSNNTTLSITSNSVKDRRFKGGKLSSERDQNHADSSSSDSSSSKGYFSFLRFF
jgi:hypothetical protein